LAAGLAVAGLAISAIGGRDALAEAVRGPVVVELEHCEQALEAEVRRIVGVELRATVIEAAGAGNDVTLVIATCLGSEVGLELVEGVTGKRLGRTVALSEAAPAARARLLALAVAELVVAGRQETDDIPRTSKQGPSPSAPTPPPVADIPEPTKTGSVRAMADAIGVVRTFPQSGVWLLGGGLRGLVAISRPLYLALEVTGEWGATSRAPGQVAGRTVGGALAAGWGMERRWAFLMPWVGARVGVASLKGEPSPGSSISSATQSGAFLGPEVGLAASLWPRAPVHATVALSAGALLLGVRGKVVQDRDVSLQGPWVALTVGAGLSKP
jgi:hypothetical protein